MVVRRVIRPDEAVPQPPPGMCWLYGRGFGAQGYSLFAVPDPPTAPPFVTLYKVTSNGVTVWKDIWRWAHS